MLIDSRLWKAQNSRMFRRTRERFERIERLLEKLAEDREREREPRRDPTDAAATFAKLLGSTLQSQADMVGSLGDIAVRSVAKRNGIRGGRQNAATAVRDKNGKFLPKSVRINRDRPRCPLCIDPMYRDVSIAMIQEHRQHEKSRFAEVGDVDRPIDDRPESVSDSEQSGVDIPEGSGNGRLH